jgi:hypothetical protein
LSQAFSPRYFSWTNGDPHRSGFKFQTAVLSVLCVMFQILLLLLLLLYGCLLSQAFSPRYFSWTNGDPHRSGFKFQTAVLSVLCVMFQILLLLLLLLLLTANELSLGGSSPYTMQLGQNEL